jgi:hypothetical protein
MVFHKKRILKDVKLQPKFKIFMQKIIKNRQNQSISDFGFLISAVHQPKSPLSILQKKHLRCRISAVHQPKSYPLSILQKKAVLIVSKRFFI